MVRRPRGDVRAAPRRCVVSYEDMTVAELRRLCDGRGVDVPSKCRKAELVAMLERLDAEPVEVEAEVIGDGHVELVPAVIDAAAYLEARRSWVERMMEPYADMDDEAICAMDADEAAVCRADLNRIINEVEAERKAIKARYNEPLARFEAEVKAMLEPARDGAARLKEYIDDQKRVQRDMRRAGLEATYNDFAPMLVPVVPFERILEINPKWLNKSYNAGKAAQELEDAVEGIARDWNVLKGMRPMMRFYDEAEAVFFRTLSLAAAKEHDEMRTEEQARIDAMKAEQEAYREPPAPAYKLDFVEVSPEAAQESERPVEGARGPNAVESDGARLYEFRAWLTDSDVAALREWKNACGIGTGWTFKEVRNG